MRQAPQLRLAYSSDSANSKNVIAPSPTRSKTSLLVQPPLPALAATTAQMAWLMAEAPSVAAVIANLIDRSVERVRREQAAEREG
jgi:hypothetical protein